MNPVQTLPAPDYRAVAEAGASGDFEALVRAMEAQGYDDAPAGKKQEILWAAISSRPYDKLPPVKFSFLGSFFNTLNLPKLKKAFTTIQDVRPSRTKAFHPFGTVAKIEWVAEGHHPFTGLFTTGAVGFVRLSLAMSDDLYAPSAAFKLLLDGRNPSQNLVLDQSLDKQTSRDFFERAPTNHTLWPTLMPMKLLWFFIDLWLSQIAPALYQSLDHLGRVKRNGDPVGSSVTPYQLFFYAPPEIHTSPDTKEDFRTLLARIPPGSVLYRVYARPYKEVDEQIYVGYIRTGSNFVASEFGDRILSLRHAPNPGSPIEKSASAP